MTSTTDSPSGLIKAPTTFCSEPDRKAWEAGKEMSPLELREIQIQLANNEPVPDEPKRIIARYAKNGGADLSQLPISRVQEIISDGRKTVVY